MTMKTIWAQTSDYSKMANKLHTLLPSEGEVANKTKNRKLEKLRKAINCYYDLYNNGLCNRTSEFRTVFGIPSTKYTKRQYSENGNYHYMTFTETLYRLTEARMTEMIIEAWNEQIKKGTITE